MVSLLTYSLKVVFFDTVPIIGCTTNQRNIPFGYLLNFLLQGHQVPLLCFMSLQS
jgi:hypothetical protein